MSISLKQEINDLVKLNGYISVDQFENFVHSLKNPNTGERYKLATAERIARPSGSPDIEPVLNDKGYINMTMSKRKEVWKNWDTHTFFTFSSVLNEYKKENTEKSEDISIEDIPF